MIMQVVTELPYENGDDNFRPDITILINGCRYIYRGKETEQQRRNTY